MPDYTAAAMDRQYRELGEYQRRLAAIDVSGWPVSQQVDYHLVRAEMNGLEANQSSMTGPAGIGIDNYNWWLKNVHLFPYTFEQAKAIVEHEYGRVVTSLKLEEHRNRHLPPLEVADTAEEYYRRSDEALSFVLEFLRDGVMTIPDWLQPADDSDPTEERGLPSNPSIDHKAREREVLPGETHEFVGHHFDGARRARDDRPIRGAMRRYNMDWIRSEGWAAALEELLMLAGTAALGRSYALVGNEDEARKILDELLELSTRTYVSPVRMALPYLALGLEDQAFEWLNTAYEDRFWLLVFLNVEPGFDPLRSDPRFHDLLHRVGVPRG